MENKRGVEMNFETLLKYKKNKNLFFTNLLWILNHSVSRLDILMNLSFKDFFQNHNHQGKNFILNYNVGIIQKTI